MAAATWSREGGTVRFALGILIPLAAALMQGTVVPLVAIGDARPSLPILVAGSWAVAAGAREAVWWAFLGGLASDLLSGGPLGALALAGLMPVAAAGIGDSELRPRSALAGALVVAIASLATSAIYLAILATVVVFPTPVGPTRAITAGGSPSFRSVSDMRVECTSVSLMISEAI